MSRLHISMRDDAPVESKPILDVVYQKLGVVPNYYRLIGSSPVALAAFAAFQDGLSTALDSRNRERIALAVAQVNGSDYCLPAHSYLATNFAKLAPDEIALNRGGGSKDPKAEAIVKFCCDRSQATRPYQRCGHCRSEECGPRRRTDCRNRCSGCRECLQKLSERGR